MDVDQFELLGNYDSSYAKNLMVAFVKCDSKERNDCKTEAEITEWLTFKYIIRLENSKRFIPNEFGADKIQKSATLRWESISAEARSEMPQHMTRTKAIFKDSRLQIGYGGW